MGCAPSMRFRVKIGVKSDQREKISPRLPVHMGDGVRKYQEKSKQSIVFFFGGPGSQKGVLIEELIKHFGFTAINVEDIVFTYLPTKFSGSVENITDIKQLLKRDQTALTVDWILSMMGTVISTGVSRLVIIDIIPALHCIMQSDTYMQGSHEKSLQLFQKSYPVDCAIEMNVTDENDLLNATDGSAKRSKKHSDGITVAVQVDEVDKGRLEKRVEAYNECSAKFLPYFNRLQRLIRIDISSKTSARQAIVTIRDLFISLGFTECSCTTRVILFLYSERQLPNVDFNSYRIQKIRTSEVGTNCDTRTMLSMLHAVRRFIEHCESENSFLVILDAVERITEVAPSGGPSNEDTSRRNIFVSTGTLDKNVQKYRLLIQLEQKLPSKRHKTRNLKVNPE